MSTSVMLIDVVSRSQIRWITDNHNPIKTTADLPISPCIHIRTQSACFEDALESNNVCQLGHLNI